MLITLDPPFAVEDDDAPFHFRGWAQVTDPAAPDTRLHVNGVEAPIVVTHRPPRLAEFHPGVEALRFHADADLPALLRAAPAERVREPFLLEATVTTEGRARTFEYAVTDAWLARVFGRPVRARPVPPPHLQVRVAGAAAGQFHASGVRVADQIEALLAGAGLPLARFGSILDFGCGPGRLTAILHERRPDAALHGSDIDPETIAWAQASLGGVADFRVNPPGPPLPFPDASMDLICAISVFTHLPEDLQFAWLADLKRVLRPGCVLLTTKLNAAAYDLPPQVKAEAAEAGFAFWGEAAATDGLPGFYRLAYHGDDYVRREWGRLFEVLHVGAHDLNDTQDAVLLRKPS
ncbi:trans-aconitate 2-methyltransferase [Phenylobacterium sp.]|uniref:class I SAM-dependent methyltransferase n=1 Tax=Phenylobacterium sp. TaxID=1871053 RepID=UPI0025E14244|nr:class I SAM-dependent methyltransferase [Phenylobacterium sp.]MBX3484339.1 class I SAM-dependent methyltransferase [Phenylobacterium sp.]MCW5759341.1 class I SAM-dependent methyltransferase [Phenylobacterium sp.]